MRVPSQKFKGTSFWGGACPSLGARGCVVYDVDVKWWWRMGVGGGWVLRLCVEGVLLRAGEEVCVGGAKKNNVPDLR